MERESDKEEKEPSDGHAKTLIDSKVDNEGRNANSESIWPLNELCGDHWLGPNQYIYLSKLSQTENLSVDLESPFLEGTCDAYVSHKETFE